MRGRRLVSATMLFHELGRCGTAATVLETVHAASARRFVTVENIN